MQQSSWCVLGPGPWLSRGLGRRLEKKGPPHPQARCWAVGHKGGEKQGWEPGRSPSRSPHHCPPSPHRAPCLHTLNHRWHQMPGQGILFTECKEERGRLQEERKTRTSAHTPCVTRVLLLLCFCQGPASGELVLIRSLRLSVTITIH